MCGFVYLNNSQRIKGFSFFKVFFSAVERKNPVIVFCVPLWERMNILPCVFFCFATSSHYVFKRMLPLNRCVVVITWLSSIFTKAKIVSLNV